MYTDEQKIEMVEKVNELRLQGKTRHQAVDEGGMKGTSYAMWGRQFADRIKNALPADTRMVGRPRGSNLGGARTVIENKEEIVKKVDELRASGKNVKEACRECGIHEVTYYSWKKRRKKSKPSPQVFEMAKPAVLEKKVKPQNDEVMNAMSKINAAQQELINALMKR